MIHLDGLDVFVAVVDAKSFAGAARRMGMPTTTVSAKVSRLEEQLGATLLRRTTRKLSLTDVGERFYAECAPALRTIEQASSSLRDSMSDPQGILRMTAPPDIAQMVLAPIIDSYLQRYPKVQIDLRVTNSFVDLVAEKVDLAIRIGELKSSSLVVRTMTKGALSLWAGPTYEQRHGLPQGPKELASHRLIWLRTRQSNIELLDSAGKKLDLASTGWLEVDDLQTLGHYVESGLGLGLLPQFDLPVCRSKRNLIPVLPEFKTASFKAVFAYPQQSFVPMTVRTFIDTAVEATRRPKSRRQI